MSRFSIALVALLATSVSAQTRLTTSASGGERMPVLSLDGGVVAYVGLVNGVREVFTVPAIGGTATQVTTGANVIVGWGIFEAWNSLSIDDAGNRITYTNAAGVHVLDIAAGTDTLVATANILPYAQISGDGSRLVYQARVQSQHEVFIVNADGTGTQQLTTGSGPGRRLPHLRGDTVVYQALVGDENELFTIDLTSGQVSAPLTSNSGQGNRYARLSPNGTAVVWEAVVNGSKEVFSSPLSPFSPTQVTSLNQRADRTPALTQDEEVFLQRITTNLDLSKADLRNNSSTTLTSEGRAGYRRPSIDRHGTMVVYQAEHAGFSEVFVEALCYPPEITTFGQHGPPSVGTLQSTASLERCDYTFGLNTGYSANTPAALLLGTSPQNSPIQGAPNNFLYVLPIVGVGFVVDASGTASVTLQSPTALRPHSVYAQWAMLDGAANSLGIVTSKGVRVTFQ